MKSQNHYLIHLLINIPELIPYLKSHATETLFLIGLVLIFIGLIGGNIKIGTDRIPPLNRQKSKRVILFGAIMLIPWPLYFFYKEVYVHAHVEAYDKTVFTEVGKEEVIDLLQGIVDSAKPEITVTLLEDVNKGLLSKKSHGVYAYTPNRAGVDEISYIQIDRRDHIDTGIVKIEIDRVRIPKYNFSVFDIFGNPLMGTWGNRNRESITDPIHSDSRGQVELKHVPDGANATLVVKKWEAPYIIRKNNNNHKFYYDPIDSVSPDLKFSTVNGQGESVLISAVWNDHYNRYEIDYGNLKKDTLKNGNGFGILNVKFKLYGEDKDYLQKRSDHKLLFRTIRKAPDYDLKYDPNGKKISAGVKADGWKTYSEIMVRPGKYEFSLRPQFGGEEYFHRDLLVKH